MSITNEQAMQELLERKRAASSASPANAVRADRRSESLRHYDAGMFYGMTCAYWRADVITFEQYQQLTDMTAVQEAA